MKTVLKNIVALSTVALALQAQAAPYVGDEVHIDIAIEAVAP